MRFLRKQTPPCDHNHVTRGRPRAATAYSCPVTILPSTLRTRFTTAPRPLRIAAVLLALQTLAFVAVGVYGMVQLQPGRLVGGVVTGLLLVVWGAALGVGGYALLGGRVAARGPVVGAELIHLPTAWSFRGGETTWVMVFLGLSSLVVFVLALLPASTRHLVPAEEERG